MRARDERGKKWFAPCGMKGKLWEPKPTEDGTLWTDHAGPCRQLLEERRRRCSGKNCKSIGLAPLWGECVGWYADFDDDVLGGSGTGQWIGKGQTWMWLPKARKPRGKHRYYSDARSHAGDQHLPPHL